MQLSERDRLDPESREPLEELLQVLPGGLNAIADITARRAALRAVFAAADRTPSPNVKVENHTIATTDASAQIALRTYRPLKSSAVLPCLVFIHGGGMIMGDLDGEEDKCSLFSETLNVVVASLDYRKAPENPYPAGLEDCYAGYRWVAENASTLGIDPGNLGIYGGSAGGGLAIAVALMARDRGGPSLKYMMPIYPMIDDRNETPSSREITDTGVWDRAGNLEAWRWYLNGQTADQYAAPARAEDLSGMPQTFIDVGDADLFRDEAVVFAGRLMRTGIPTELHVYPGAYHGSEVFAPEAKLSQQILSTRITALRRFIEQ